MNPSLLPIPHTPCSHITSHWRMACCTFYFSQFPCEWIKWSGFPVMFPGFWGVVLKSGYCPAEFGKEAGRKRIKDRLTPTENMGLQLIISYVPSSIHPVHHPTVSLVTCVPHPIPSRSKLFFTLLFLSTQPFVQQIATLHGLSKCTHTECSQKDFQNWLPNSDHPPNSELMLKDLHKCILCVCSPVPFFILVWIRESSTNISSVTLVEKWHGWVEKRVHPFSSFQMKWCNLFAFLKWNGLSKVVYCFFFSLGISGIFHQ